MVLLSAGYKAQSQPGFGNIGFNTFYTELSPYGQWINNADYGQVWVSNENGFEPYSNNGHWDFTSYGWMWVSDYSWGWAPFHYGRWAYLPAYGWAWVPGYEWAPAWVGWCSYDGYYGWAPLSPGLSFNYSFSSIPYERWRFVQYQYINNPYVYNHYVRPPRNINSNNITIINNTTVNNNVTYAAGPAKLDVERLTKTTIQPKAVAFDETPGKKTVIEKNEIRMYRPAIVKDAATEKIKPATQTKLPVKEEVAGQQSTRQQSVNQQQVLIKQTPQQDEIKKQQQAELINKQP